MRPDKQGEAAGEHASPTDTGGHRDIAELRSIAVTVMGTNDVSVIRDDTAPTAFTDNEGSIVVTLQLVPQQLRQNELAVATLFDAQVLHEAGHNVRDREMDREAGRIITRHRGIGQYVWFVLSDIRVNHFIRTRYAYDDYSRRLVFLMELAGPAWHDGVLKDLKAVDKKRSPGQAYASAVGMKLVYGVDVADILKCLDDQGAFRLRAMTDDLEALGRLGDEYRLVMNPAKAYDLMERSVAILKRYVEDMPLILIPRFLHGHGDLEVPDELAAKLGLDGGACPPRGRLRSKPTMSRGIWTGLEVPPPAPDKKAYLEVRNEVMPEVHRLLDMLKRAVGQTARRSDWQRTGRLMYHVLPTAIAASRVGPVENIHSRTSVTTEKQKVAICLLVDLSSSMDQLEAQKVLTVVAEVCGRWLRDDAYAILSFGGTFQRVKVFCESYHNTRARIGGLRDMGATEAVPPTIACHKLLRGIGGGSKRVMVFVSDFQIEEPADIRPEWEAMRREGIAVMGISMGQDRGQARRYLGQDARHIASVGQLPEAFFSLYAGLVGAAGPRRIPS